MWPVTLIDGDVVVRPLRLRDTSAWVEVRRANEEWLAPWEGTPASLGPPVDSWEARHSPSVYTAMLRRLRSEAREGRGLPFGVTYQGRFVGQVSVNGITRGAFDSCWVGYWVDSRVSGRGVTPTALALVVDHCLGAAGLHRVEANVRPDNAASRRVVEKLGFREEGLHLRYLYIDGAWRDHVSYAVTAEDLAGTSMLARWQASR